MTFKLIDYKGKWDIICDEDRVDDTWDVVVGEISKEDAIKEAPQRVEACRYYGIPSYFGADKELNDLYERLNQEYDQKMQRHYN